MNKSLTRGAQLVPIGIPTTCLYNLVPNFGSGLFHESSGGKSLTAVKTRMMEVDLIYLSANTATPPLQGLCAGV